MSQGSDLGPNPMGKKNVKGKTAAEVQMCRLCQEGGLLGTIHKCSGPTRCTNFTAADYFQHPQTDSESMPAIVQWFCVNYLN